MWLGEVQCGWRVSLLLGVRPISHSACEHACARLMDPIRTSKQHNHNLPFSAVFVLLLPTANSQSMQTQAASPPFEDPDPEHVRPKGGKPSLRGFMTRGSVALSHAATFTSSTLHPVHTPTITHVLFHRPHAHRCNMAVRLKITTLWPQAPRGEWGIPHIHRLSAQPLRGWSQAMTHSQDCFPHAIRRHLPSSFLRHLAASACPLG